MLNQLISIAKNTFKETIRQPVYAVIIIAVMLLLIISPSITMYSLGDDNKLLRELGLSTLFLAGLFIAIFSAATAITEEIQTKTIITTLSKPISRPLFIIGKFLGVVASVFLAHYLFSIAYLMCMRHGVSSTAADQSDMTVIISAIMVIGLSIIITTFLNYFYDWKFTSTAIVLCSILATLAITFLLFIDSNWKFNPAENNIYAFDVYASILLLIALLVLSSTALMFSSRFNVVITLSCSISVFLLGLISSYVFGRFAEEHLWAKIGRTLIPDLQVFWVTDAIYEYAQVPAEYIVIAASYGLAYTAAIICITIALFQKRQIG